MSIADDGPAPSLPDPRVTDPGPREPPAASIFKGGTGALPYSGMETAAGAKWAKYASTPQPQAADVTGPEQRASDAQALPLTGGTSPRVATDPGPSKPPAASIFKGGEGAVPYSGMESAAGAKWAKYATAPQPQDAADATQSGQQTFASPAPPPTDDNAPRVTTDPGPSEPPAASIFKGGEGALPYSGMEPAAGAKWAKYEAAEQGEGQPEPEQQDKPEQEQPEPGKQGAESKGRWGCVMC